MSTLLVAVADSVFPSLEPAQQVLAEVKADLRLAAEPTPEAILAEARQADGLMVTYAKITAEIIRQLERCQIIARMGIGIDNIDIDAATQAGIVVTYVPDYCVDEVSDQAMALLLALARKVTYANQLVQSGRWEMSAVVPLNRLRGRTLGLVGFGKIPLMVAHEPAGRAVGNGISSRAWRVDRASVALHGNGTAGVRSHKARHYLRDRRVTTQSARAAFHEPDDETAGPRGRRFRDDRS
jgi:phosphoglycerate dehydrogenase-like enzyme